jgi:hypothetical protein
MRTTGFAAGRAIREVRGDLPDFALLDLPALARDPAILAFLAAGFLVFEAFFAGISFSAPG